MNLIKFYKWPNILARSQRGIAAVEFALSLPILIALLLGAGEITYALLINQRVERVAYSVADIVTQSSTLTIADLNTTLLAADQIMQPFPFGGNGVVIVTSVYQAPGQNPAIMWQYTGGGTLARGSKIGVTGGVPNLPNGLTLNDNDNVILCEVYYAYTPLFITSHILTAGDVYRVTVYKPRLSPLIVPPA